MTWKIINLRELDGGGRGDLYLGERDDTGETVVVKYLRDYQLEHERRGFAREVRILGRRIHQRVVQIIGARLDVKRPYYVMPYFPGGSLKRFAGRLNHKQLRLAAKIDEFEDIHGNFWPGAATQKQSASSLVQPVPKKGDLA